MRIVWNILLVVVIVAVLAVVGFVLWGLRLRRSGEGFCRKLAAQPRPSLDLSTPEGAILCLEDAYRRRDLEAAVACRDFVTQARQMLGQLQMPMDGDAELV